MTSNFQGTGPLVGFTSSTGTVGSPSGPYEGSATPDPDNNINGDDNGQIGGVLGTNTGLIDTGLVTLTVGQEPINDGDTDDNTNLTLDLGVFKPLSIGDTVFNDLNNNGTKDTERGRHPRRHRPRPELDGTATASVVTNAQGVYSIGFLPAGTYTIEISSPATSTPAARCSGSSPAPAGPATPSSRPRGRRRTTRTTGRSPAPWGAAAASAAGPSPWGPRTTTSIDFGVFQQTPGGASLAGRVFRDFNNDGKFNGPDTAISGVTVYPDRRRPDQPADAHDRRRGELQVHQPGGRDVHADRDPADHPGQPDR